MELSFLKGDMLDKKRIMSFVLLISFFIAVIPSVSFAADRTYAITQADLDLFVHENGMLKVQEKYYYSFNGTYHGVYRDIPLKNGQDIRNIKVTANGAYCTYEITDNGNVKTITVYLYSNPEKTIPITNKNVQVTLKYDFINAITIYNDVSELHYKIWGEFWDVDVEKINANIHLPSNETVKYWFYPTYYLKNTSFNNSTLHITTTKIPHRNYFEIMMAIPLNEFKNPLYAQKINASGMLQIEKSQEQYQNKIDYDAFIYKLVAFLMIISIIIPIFIYLMYGREPKIEYNDQYEREPPTNDPPVMVNALSGKVPGKPVGIPDMDGFLATIMDLIYRKYIILIEYRNDINNEKYIELKINSTKELIDLYKFETDLIDILSNYKIKNNISLDKMKKDLNDSIKARSFKKNYDLWKKEVKAQFFSDNDLEQFFIEKGDKYIEKYGIVAIIVSLAVFFRSASDPAPYALYGIIGSIILGIAGILAFILPYKISGRWTEYGMEYNARWQNFIKFINDFSLIKEQPPESIVIWNQYLVYATALGVADEVRDIMDDYLPEEFRNSDIYVFHSHGGYIQMKYALNSGVATAIQANTGPGGGAGGGSGGGGGGAF